MGLKQSLVFLSVFLSCYLILFLPFASAYQIGELQKTKFIVEPVLRIVDDLKPVNCESSGYITFHAYVENVPEFDIESSEAFVEDISGGETYNVSSSISCFPKTGLISNQEITCSLRVNEMLSRIPSCPFERTENRFYMTLEISYGDRRMTISDEKDFVITQAGTEPGIEIKFDVSWPAYPVPEINCRTGSEIEIPVVIKNAETLFGEIMWSFSVNGTGYGGDLMECDKVTTREGEGREDIYLCTLVISSIAFTECEEGSNVWVAARARTEDFDISGNFSTVLVSEELNLGLRLSGIEKLECQIIDENGTCIPKEPQQNVTARITGNVPPRLKVFETRYKLGDGEITTTHCRKIRYDRYECLAFITVDMLPLPASKEERTSGSRELTIFLDVKHLNYYTDISDSTTVETEGVILDGILDTMNALEQKKDFLESIKDPLPKWLTKGMIFVDRITGCCDLVKLVDQWKDVDVKLEEGVISKFRAASEKIIGTIEALTGRNVWNFQQGIIKNAINFIITYGPGVLTCAAEAGIKIIEEEQEKLLQFESGAINEPLEIPDSISIWKLLEDNAPECFAEQLWPKREWWEWMCRIVLFILKVIPATKGIADTVCKFMKYVDMAIDKIQKALNLWIGYVTTLGVMSTFSKVQESIALARERLNLQTRLEAERLNITTAYIDAFENTMDAMITGTITHTLLGEMVSPQYDTIKLLFISDRTGMLDHGDEICVGDSITIEYNFEKLNQTEGFVSKLLITPNRLGGPLLFGDLKGTYGPQFTDNLLGTNPGYPDFDPSETYTFTLVYENENKRLDYELYYVNRTCI
ncbi:MAG: hypothetical protein JSV39_03045 [Candidatus Aenigmatarchaeota archaeon]|nr:MAG: hypothetical protein JSV39_03045 [Candidatus Aenigmarchaeota archaeon]